MLSLTGRRWTESPVDAQAVARLARDHDLPEVVARCLLRRQPQESPGWLSPSLDALHDPSEMLGMEAATALLEATIADKERIRIVTDYDVDGTTSSLILQSTLTILGAGGRVDYHIPHRFGEGYGFSTIAAQKAVDDGVGLIITADIGVRDHEAVRIAREGGVKVLICDHHLPSGASVPQEANVVLCPPQEGCTYPNPALAACGVSLKLAQALLASHPKRDAVLRSMLKVAAIGTVADVVDLSTPENRAIVQLGLEELNKGPHAPGLTALLEVCGLRHDPIAASDLGFRIGPRINAAGRLDDARAVVDLFLERNYDTARAMAARLDQTNRERQAIQSTLVEQCLAAIDLPPPHFAVMSGDEGSGWHRGVVGIVAAKVRDRIHRPVAIVAISGDEARGSVRSVPQVHAVQALDAAQDLLVRYGGHPAAAGFTVKTENIDALRERLDQWVAETVHTESLVPVLEVDGTCEAAEVTFPLVKSMQALEPHGKGNPAPLLRVRVAKPSDIRIIGTRHVKFRAGDVDVVWWGAAEHLDALSGPLEVVGTPGINRYKGRVTLQITAEDIRPTAAREAVG